MRWIQEMDDRNFLAIYDVMLDIKTEMNISPDEIIIPQFQHVIKFTELFPVDSVGTRGDYCLARLKAAKFLKTKGIIRDFTVTEGWESWTNRFSIKLQKEAFEEVLPKMKTEYEKRFAKEVKRGRDVTTKFWHLLHPKIVKVSKSRFEANHFADSVEAALKEVNSVAKGIVKQKTGQEYDGADLMNKAFSINNPIIVLDDLSTETGKDLQKGYMQIFSGAMTGIRNPKAHENITIDATRALHFLFLASLLMLKIDERK